MVKRIKIESDTNSMPAHVDPMLCTLVKDPLDSSEYLYELKWDGYRIISKAENGQVRMNSRSGLDYTAKYPLIAEALSELGHDVIIDGEVVVLNEEGKPDFDTLQLYNGKRTPIRYCVFDLLYLDGSSIMDLPLYQRKELLETLVRDREIFLFSESFDNGKELYEKVLRDNMEGIVAKKKDSIYVPGARGYDWLKIPTRKRQEFVIGGWAESDKSRSFKSLLFGTFEKGEFTWIGRSGGGYKQIEMPGILKMLKKIEIEKSPFVNKVLDTKGARVHYVKPKLVANFEFAAWTKSGRIRKPATFLGFRKDKNPRDVVREVPKEIEQVIEQQQREEQQTPQSDDPALERYNDKRRFDKTPEPMGGYAQGEETPALTEIKHETVGALFLQAINKRPARSRLSPGSNWNRIFEEKIKSEGSIAVENQTIRLSNIEKKLWKSTNKAQLISYYNSVAQFILPYLKHRPLSLLIKIHSAPAPGFFIKDMEGFQPDFVDIYPARRKHKAKGKAEIINYAVCNNLPALLWLINLGCIDLNPWNSVTENPAEPDFVAIDLDPSDEDFKKAVKTALAAREYFNEQKLSSFIKTSGKTGIHIFIPCKGFSYPQARTLAERICAEIHLRVPEITTLEVSTAHRGKKLFVDFSQNDEADTLAAVYSVRPAKQPIVSTPIDWEELSLKLKPADFTIQNTLSRLLEKGDLWQDLQDPQIKTKNSGILKKILNQDISL